MDSASLIIGTKRTGLRWGHALVSRKPVDTLRDTLFVKCHRWEIQMRAYQCPIRLSRSERLQHNKCKSVHASHKFLNLHSAQRTSQCIHDRPWSTWLTCSSLWMIYFLVLKTLSSIATTFFSQHPGRDSQGPRVLPGDYHLLGSEDKCVVVATGQAFVPPEGA